MRRMTAAESAIVNGLWAFTSVDVLSGWAGCVMAELTGVATAFGLQRTQRITKEAAAINKVID